MLDYSKILNFASTIILKANLHHSKFSVFLSSHSLPRPRGSWIPVVALTKCFRFRINLTDNTFHFPFWPLPGSLASESASIICAILMPFQRHISSKHYCGHKLQTTHASTINVDWNIMQVATLPHNAAFTRSTFILKQEHEH